LNEVLNTSRAPSSTNAFVWFRKEIIGPWYVKKELEDNKDGLLVLAKLRVTERLSKLRDWAIDLQLTELPEIHAVAIDAEFCMRLLIDASKTDNEPPSINKADEPVADRIDLLPTWTKAEELRFDSRMLYCETNL
jgi:hypothetical protein